MPEQEDLQIVMKAKDILKKGDFETAFKKVIELILKIQQQQSEAIARIEETHKLLLQRTQNDYSKGLSDLKGQVDNVFVGKAVDGMKTEHNQRTKLMDEKLKAVDIKIAKVKDGYTPKKGVDYNDGRTPKKGVDYFDGLLDEKALEELKKELKEYADNKVKAIPRPMGMKKITYQRSHDMSDQVDGVKKVFTLPTKTLAVRAVRISYFPYNLRPTIDYTVNGTNLTLTSEIATPPLTHTIIADIEVSFFY